MKRSGRYPLSVRNGRVLVGSDAHFWPKQRSTAFAAFVRMAAELDDLKAIVMNGDVIDGASISRHARIGWEFRPTVKQELEVAQERLIEIEDLGRKVPLIWTLGNHDARFEMRLAEVAPEYADVHGIHLKDHFPKWKPAWSVEINRNTIIKHRWKGGTHAAFNNAKDSGRNTVTGHLHALNVSAFTDYNGTRFGVDGGTLADPAGPQFSNYTEDNPLNWRSGFVSLRYVNGDLQWPEVLYVMNEKKRLVNFNGRTIKI
jgi:hypothetical protein